jgi:hypothetical protein
MVHASLHWSEQGLDDLSLWSFMVNHLVWLYNRLPNALSDLTPLELLTKSKSNHCDLLCCHVWGCPVFVLKPKLQKLPKWNRQAQMGQFLGFSDKHSSLVVNVRNFSSRYISPQFHLVFDYLFETVICAADDDIVFNAICNDLFDLNRDWYAKDEYDKNEKLIYQPPPLEDVWLDEQGRQNWKREM